VLLALVLLELAVADVLDGSGVNGLGVAVGLDGGSIGVSGLGGLALGIRVRLEGVEVTSLGLLELAKACLHNLVLGSEGGSSSNRRSLRGRSFLLGDLEGRLGTVECFLCSGLLRLLRGRGGILLGLGGFCGVGSLRFGGHVLLSRLGRLHSGLKPGDTGCSIGKAFLVRLTNVFLVRQLEGAIADVLGDQLADRDAGFRGARKLHLLREEIVDAVVLGEDGSTKASEECDILQHFEEACLVTGEVHE